MASIKRLLMPANPSDAALHLALASYYGCEFGLEGQESIAAAAFRVFCTIDSRAIRHSS